MQTLMRLVEWLRIFRADKHHATLSGPMVLVR